MASFGWKNSAWVPAVICILITSTLICIMIIGVVTHEVPLFLPYISDAGGVPPASGIFGFFIGLAAGLISLAMVIRYGIVINSQKSANILKANHFAIVLGQVSLIFLLLVLNFPCNFEEFKKDSSGHYQPMTFKWLIADQAPHYTSAILFYVICTLYMIVETYLTFKIKKDWMAGWRLFLIAFHLVLSACSVSMLCILSSEQQALSKMPWGPLLEWSMTIIFTLYISSFVRELKDVPVVLSIPDVSSTLLINRP